MQVFDMYASQDFDTGAWNFIPRDHPLKATVNGMEISSRYAEQHHLETDANHRTSCVIVGAGPAGLAPLIAAARSQRLQELLDNGIVIVDAGDRVGCGEIGRYAISSDSAAEAFLDAITKTQYPEIAALWDDPIVQDLSHRIGQSVPLPIVAKFLALIGSCLCEMVRSSARGRVLLLHKALWTRQTSDGGWMTCVQDQETGAIHKIASDSVVIATGAEQPLSRLHTEVVAGQPLLPKYAGKVMQSGFVLKPAGLREVRRVLQRYEEPKVVIVGGSTSAGAVARMLLGKKMKLQFSAGSVTLLHRRPFRIFYPSAAAALEDGYTDFGPEDIRPVSGRVYRLAGFRLDSRELMMRALKIGGREGVTRLKLHRMQTEDDAEAAELLEQSHLIISAMGYPIGNPRNPSGHAVHSACERHQCGEQVEGGVMRGYLKLKKIDVPIEDGLVIRDEVPLKNVDYTLLVKVCLKSFEKTQIEADEDDEEIVYNLEINGPIQLLPVDFGLSTESLSPIED